jgi:DNA-binding transcriptional MocR family regulator
MTPEVDKTANLEVTLRMMASLRRDAELYSEKEGVSLDQFVNVAVAEKLAHLQHEEWIRKRRPITEERRERALALLKKAGTDDVEPGDEIPKGYVPL